MYIQKEKYVTLLHGVKQAQFQKEVLKREITILSEELKNQKLTNFQLSSKFSEMKQYVLELKTRLEAQNAVNQGEHKYQKDRLIYEQLHRKDPQGVSTAFDYQNSKPMNFGNDPQNNPTVFQPIGNILGNPKNQVEMRLAQEAKMWQNQKQWGTPGRVQWSAQGRQFPNQGQGKFQGDEENVWQYRGQNPYLNHGHGNQYGHGQGQGQGEENMWQYRGQNPYLNEGPSQNYPLNYEQGHKSNNVHRPSKNPNHGRAKNVQPNEDEQSSQQQNQDQQIQTQVQNPQAAQVPGQPITTGQPATQIFGQTGAQVPGQTAVQVPGQEGLQNPIANGALGFNQFQSQLQTILDQIKKIKPKKKKKKNTPPPKP